MIVNGLSIGVPFAVALTAGVAVWLYLRRDDEPYPHQVHHEKHPPQNMGPRAGLSSPFAGYNSHLPTRPSPPKVDSTAPAVPAAAVEQDTPGALPPPPVKLPPTVRAELARLRHTVADLRKPDDPGYPWEFPTGEFTLRIAEMEA